MRIVQRFCSHRRSMTHAEVGDLDLSPRRCECKRQVAVEDVSAHGVAVIGAGDVADAAIAGEDGLLAQRHGVRRIEGYAAKPTLNAGGFGLHGMRERAEVIGAQLTIRSEPGQGTTITLVVPLGSAREKSQAAARELPHAEHAEKERVG